MDTPSSANAAAAISAARRAQVLRVVEACIEGRLNGSSISDQELIELHGELMPELAEALRMAALIADVRSAGTPAGSSATVFLADLRPSGSEPAASPASTILPSIPGYEILREVQRGGQGVVFQAVQLSTGRVVAIKIVRGGPLARPHDRARFEREVRILARLNHPNIVSIHDSGRSGGDYFYVMDYVAGESFDEHVADLRPDVAATLRTFLRVCDAVHAAHLQGVIHRDLKPANVRIGLDGQPRVLDFGLARLDSAEDGPAMALTQSGQFVGSLPWASPEQVESGAGGIDLRSDVYSLGVMAYQALTGRFPYPVTGSARETMNHILATEAAGARMLAPWVDEEADAIARMCLRKNPARRYQSAGELAADIRRYLSGEPVAAKRDSRWYVVRKSVRRHWMPIAAAAAFVTLLAAATLSVTSLYFQSEGQRQIAERRRGEAETEARRARAAQQFLEDLIASVDPESAQGREPAEVFADVLDRAAERIDAEFAERPEVAADLRLTLGRAYDGLGRAPAALPLLESTLEAMLRAGEPDARVADVRCALGKTLFDLQRFDKAETQLTLALETRRRLGDDAGTVDALDWLGNLADARGDSRAAESHHAEALQLVESHFGPEHPRVASCLANLANAFCNQGRWEEARDLLHRAVEIQTRALGQNSPTLNITRNSLAVVYDALGEYAAAKDMYAEILATARRVCGPDHPSIATMLLNLGSTCANLGEFDVAEQHVRAAGELLQEHHPHRHRDRVQYLNALGTILERAGRPAEAETALRAALDVADTRLEPSDPLRLNVLNSLAVALSDLDRSADALPLLRDVVATCREQLGADHPNLASALCNYGLTCAECGRAEEGEAAMHEAIAIYGRSLGSAHPLLVTALTNLAQIQFRRGDLSGAESSLVQAVELARQVLGPGQVDLAEALESLAFVYAADQKRTLACAAQREAVSIYVSSVGELDPRTHAARQQLNAYESREDEQPPADRPSRGP